MSTPALEQLFDRIPSLADQPREIEELSGGLTNLNLKVTTPKGVFVARCSRSDTSLLGIDREAEHANTRSAELAGVGAPVVEFRPDLDVLVIGFIDGRSFENEDLRKPDALTRVAEACRTLHAGPRFVGDFDMFTRQATYLASVIDGAFGLPDDYGDFAAQFQQIRAALAVNAGPTVPCNNDLLAGNFVDDGEKLWLIDYEYSGNNDPFFELGNTWTECELDDDHLTELVDAYVGHHSAEKIARTRLQATVSRYGWSLWGYIQAATSDQNFDFHGWGQERFEKAVEDFRSPRLEDLLDSATGFRT
ncbi:MAG: phosphotransferase [Aeromicrobium sp.]